MPTVLAAPAPAAATRPPRNSVSQVTERLSTQTVYHVREFFDRPVGFHPVLQHFPTSQLATARDQRGWTALHHACWRACTDTHSKTCTLTEVNSLLLSSGADPAAATGRGWTPLHILCWAGKVGVFVLKTKSFGPFLTSSAMQTRTSGIGWLPLHQLAACKPSKYFPENGARHGKARDGIAAVLEAAARAGVLNASDAYGRTPLMLAAEMGHEYIVQELMNKGADVKQCNEQSLWSPLMYAARAGQSEVVNLLLDYGADCTAASKVGLTALHLAVMGGHLDIIKTLRRSASRDMGDAAGFTPLHLACVTSALPVFDALLCDTSRLDERTADGSTTLHLAVQCGNEDAMVALLAAIQARAQTSRQIKIDVLAARDEAGRTPLELAQELKRAGLVAVLTRAQQ